MKSSESVLVGINPVREALKAGRRQVRRVWVASDRGADERIIEIERLAAEAGVPVDRVPRDQIAHLAGGAAHQGIAAFASARQHAALADLVDAVTSPPLILVLDGVEDPRNLGAILRTADAAGVNGVVVPTRRSAELGVAAAKASAGAIEHVRVAEVTNISQALEVLKRRGLWIAGFAHDGATRWDQLDYTGPTAVVFGGEEAGMRRLVRSHCDFVGAIPMRGAVASLNVAVAVGVVLFEALRQRLARGK